MFREISQDEFEPFLLLMAEVEAGDHFDERDPRHVEWLRALIGRRFSSGVRFYAMYEGETPIGFAGLMTETSLHTDWTKSELMDIGVFPKYRGAGHGTALLRFIEDLAREARSYSLCMRTYAADYKVIAFYGRNGYTPVATIPDDNGPGDEGTVIMRKALGSA